MLDHSKIKERISVAHLELIALAAGSVVEEIKVDVDSVDATIVHPGKFHPTDMFQGPKIEIQLKATTGCEWKNGLCAFNLSIKNYNDLRERSMCPRLLVVYQMPKDPKSWVVHDEDHLRTHHCAYWHNLCGSPDVNNDTTRCVHIRKANVLSPGSLTELLRRAARGEALGDVL